MHSYTFEWVKFFKYYMTKNNLHHLKIPVELMFYVQSNKYTGEWSAIQSYSKYCITMKNVVIYITYNQDGWIFFNVVRVENNKNLGDHMTIGLKDKKKGLVDLHYTVQNTTLHHSEKKICFLKDFMEIEDFDKILCANPHGGQMKDHFTPDQLKIMEEIIKLPFLKTEGGGGTLTRKHLSSICQQMQLQNNYEKMSKKDIYKLICN